MKTPSKISFQQIKIFPGEKNLEFSIQIHWIRIRFQAFSWIKIESRHDLDHSYLCKNFSWPKNGIQYFFLLLRKNIKVPGDDSMTIPRALQTWIFFFIPFFETILRSPDTDPNHYKNFSFTFQTFEFVIKSSWNVKANFKFSFNGKVWHSEPRIRIQNVSENANTYVR